MHIIYRNVNKIITIQILQQTNLFFNSIDKEHTGMKEIALQEPHGIKTNF